MAGRRYQEGIGGGGVKELMGYGREEVWQGGGGVLKS